MPDKLKIFMIDNKLIKHGDHVIFLPLGSKGQLPVIAHELFPLGQIKVLENKNYSVVQIPEWLVTMRCSGDLQIIQIR